jgi:hypothetical protein
MRSRKKIAVLSLMAVAGAVLILTQTASSNRRAYKLEGAWTQSTVGALGSVTLAPSDPSGREATGRISWPTSGPAIGELQALYGADASPDWIGEVRMISRNTAKYTTVGYWVKSGVPDEIKVILIGTGTLTFTGPDSAVSQGTFSGYLPSTDANGDGLPDSLENPEFGPLPGDSVFTRIPMLP